MRYAMAIAAILILAGCKVGGISLPGAPNPGATWPGGGPAVVSMAATDWDFRDPTGAHGHPEQATSGVTFAFVGEVDMLTTDVSIAAKDRVHALVRIDAPPTTTFRASEGTCPPTFRIFLEVRFDNLTANGGEDGRWWARLQGQPVTPGTSVTDVSLTDLSQWSNVQGHIASDRPAEFKATITKLGAVGITFGGCAFAHGVIPSGEARVTISEFSVQ